MNYFFLLTISILIFLYLKMKTSRSSFFFKDKNILDLKRQLMMQVLIDKGYSNKERIIFNMAFKFFIENPSRFDGATIVGDHYLIEGLSPTAMKHDYKCIMISRKSLKFYVKRRIECDTEYRNDLIKVKRKYWINKATAYIMWGFLIITSPIYYYLTGGKKKHDFLVE